MFIILQIFFVTCAVVKIGYSPVQDEMKFGQAVISSY